MKALKDGYTAPPADARHTMRESSDHPQQEHADAWLNWCWNTLAEPMPDSKVEDYKAIQDVIDVGGGGDDLADASEAKKKVPELLIAKLSHDDLNEWVLGPSPSGSATAPLSSARSLLQMTFASFFSMYECTCTGQPTSRSTFMRAWEQGDWSEKIKFLPVGHHSTCAECAKFREWRRTSKTDSDRLKVEEARTAHITTVMLDRASVSRLDEIARRSVCQDYMQLPNDTRHGATTIDGMDQAKFRVPRWKFAKISKDLEGLWRPALHVHGTITHGCCGTFFIC